MVRKFTVVAAAFALMLTSCGHQVTPNRTGTNANGLPSGYIEVKWTMQNPVNFVNDWYVTSFNVTCTDPTGQRCMPYAAYGNTIKNWQNWDYEVIVYQPNTSSGVQAAMYEFVTQSAGGGTQKVPLPITGIIPNVDLQLLTNCNGTANQFCLILNRRLFNGVPPVNGATPPPPTSTWYVDWVVASAGTMGGVPGTPINAPGPNGPNDAGQFQFPTTTGTPGIPINTAFDQQWFANASWPQPSDPAAVFNSGEVINSP